MPYVTKKSGSQFCVYKKGASKPVPNGCYSSKKDADKRRDAMNINVNSMRAAREVTFEPIPSTDGLLSVVRNVEVCAVGIEYPLASGPKTFTPEDLQAAVASQDDPAIQAPRVWLGHPDDDRFHAGRATPAGSAEPALGKVINMRIEDNGMTLVGDVAGCPTWLASILASAYPNRSIEGFTGAETVTGGKWDLVITDLALLGVTWPGVSTLDDLEALYSEDGPEGVEVEEVDVTVAAARAITAQVNVDDVRRAFYAALGSDVEIGGWPWIRAMLQEPDELIVDDDEGGLWRVPYAIEGDQISFEDPVQVKIEYVNASQREDPHARTLLTSMLTNQRTIAASWDQRAASRPDSNNQEDHGMTPEQIRLLRARLGLTEEQLPDDATTEQINAALEQPSPDQEGAGPTAGPGPTPSGQQPSSTTDPGTPETPSPDQQPGLAREEQPVEAPPVAASAALPAGMVAVPAEEWRGMQASVRTITAGQAATQQENDLRTVADALRAGKIFPSQREHYEARVKDPNTRDAFVHLLTASVDEGGLAPNLVPVTARGVDPSASDLSNEAYPTEWLPEVQARTGDGSPITQEG